MPPKESIIKDLLNNDKYLIKDIFINDNNQLSIYIIKTKDYNYNNDYNLTPRELMDLKKILEDYFDKTVIIDYVNKLLVFL
jgi:hypothetical protein